MTSAFPYLQKQRQSTKEIDDVLQEGVFRVKTWSSNGNDASNVKANKEEDPQPHC